MINPGCKLFISSFEEILDLKPEYRMRVLKCSTLIISPDPAFCNSQDTSFFNLYLFVYWIETERKLDGEGR